MTLQNKQRGKAIDGDFRLPLPLYERIGLTPIHGFDRGFTVALGLDRKLVSELKSRSLDMNDAALQKGTSDYRRFGVGSYEAWYAKGRIPFALVDGKGALAALIWFGPEPLPSDIGYKSGRPEEWDTIAFRSYEPYRGKRLMKPFGSVALAFFAKHRSGRKLWLETNVDNTAGLRLYEKLGFTARGTRQGNGRIVMTRE